MHRLTPWRRASPLVAFGAQLAFVLLLFAYSPHFGGGCPQSAAAQVEADRFDHLVTAIDIGLLTAAAVTIVVWSGGRHNRPAWIGLALVPAIVLAGLGLAVAGLETVSLCNMIQT